MFDAVKGGIDDLTGIQGAGSYITGGLPELYEDTMTNEDFDFDEFYNRLNEKGFVIYPGKVTKADCFRIGHIGHLFPEDTKALLAAIQKVSSDMNLSLA